MDMDLRTLRAFVAVASDGSFTTAAERLGLSQPTVSWQIRALEQRIGVRLFARTTRRTALTDEGARLLPAARRLVDEADRLRQTVAEIVGRGRRPLRLGAAFYTLDIPERKTLVERFMAAHGAIALDIDTRWERELVPAVIAGTVDLALIIGFPLSRAAYERASVGADAGEIVYPDDLARLCLRRERIALQVPDHSPLAALDEIPPAALAGQRVAMIDRQHGAALVDPLSAALESAGASLVHPPEGHGIGVERYGRQFGLPAVSLGWFAPQPGTVRRPVAGIDLATEFALIGGRNAPSAAAQAFLDLAREQVR